MTSYISDKVSNFWQNESSIKLGGSFAVQWLCQCDFHFSNVKHISNPLNNNESIIKSRDTQELPKELGVQICNLLFEKEKAEIAQKPGKSQILDDPTITKIQEEIKKNRESKFFYFFNFFLIEFLQIKQGNLMKNNNQMQMQMNNPQINNMQNSWPMSNNSGKIFN